MANIPLEGAIVIGALIGVGVFGVYTCLFLLTCLYLRRTPGYSIGIVINLSILWILTLISIILQVSCFYGGFVNSMGKMGTMQYFMRWTTSWQYLMGIIVTHISGILGNAFICWRLYVFWKGSRKIMIAPLILFLALIVCCGITIGYEVKFTRAIRYRALRDQWLQAVFIISLLINLAAIGLMCWKIYRVSKSVSDLSPAANILYKHTFQVFIEGGALYAVAIIVSLSLHAANLLAAALIVDYLIPHVIGLVPTLIVLRLLVQRTSQSRRASGHDTAPPISQQKTLTQPMFAQATVGDTTGVSEFGRSIHVQAHPTACSDESKWTRNDKVVPSTVCSTEHSK